jgi:membrane fusion protein, multidrug efflux system
LANSDLPGDEQIGPRRSGIHRLSTVARVLIAMAAAIAIGTMVWIVHWWTTGRFFETTNDAFIQADQVIVAPKIAGYVSQVYVVDNQEVNPGDPLVRIDSRQYQAALKRAQATIDAREADIKRATAALSERRAMSAQAEAQRANARASATYAAQEVHRYEPLAKTGADTEEHLAKLRNEREQAMGAFRASAAASTANERSVESMQAQVSQARAQLEVALESAGEAQLDLDDTVIKSSIGGRVGDRSVRAGQYVQAGTRMMTLVATQKLYITANFKETQIRNMRAGQPVKIDVDALSGTELRGTVESFSPGTGAQFSLLPPENATGNFTKIVQRVPVRIRLQPNDAVRDRLIPGLSITVEVDTRPPRGDAPGTAARKPT